MAVFVKTRFFLQRAFIIGGWLIFAYLVGKALISGIENSHLSFSYVFFRALMFPAAGHAFAWVIRVGMYE